MTIASIDIGSNTVLLLIAEVDLQTQSLKILTDQQKLPRISEGLIPGGEISKNSLQRLFSVLQEYSALIKTYNCQRVIISGTNAFRIASNAEEIKTDIFKKFNFELNILSGTEEAEFAFIGTREYGDKNKSRLVIDIGGGSTELIFGKNNIQFSQSYNAGVVSLSEGYIYKNETSFSRKVRIESHLAKLFTVLPEQIKAPDIAIALAGTPVTLACIRKGLTNYNEYEVEGYNLSINDVRNLYNYLSKFSPYEIYKLHPSIIKGREDLILSGTIILLYLMELFKLEYILVSTKGIRYGAILKFASDYK